MDLTKWGQNYKVFVDTGGTFLGFQLDTERGILDSPSVLDGFVDYADVTDYVTSINIRRGRPDQLSTMPIGQASIVLDDKAAFRAFDPSNTASPYTVEVASGTSPGVSLAPMRYVQIYGGTASDRPLFFGRIADIDIEYQQPDQSFAYISAVDDLAQLARTNLTAFTPTSQLSSERVAAILDRPEVAYSTANRAISTGVATLGTVAYEDNVNVKSVLDAIAQAEDGRFFVSAGGTVTFQSRTSNIFGTAVLTFSDAGTAIPYQGLSVSYGAETLYNRIQIGVEGQSVATAIGTSSIDQFGVQTLALDNVPLVDMTAGTILADNLLTKYQYPAYRFDGLELVLNGLSAGTAQSVSTLELGNIIRINKSFWTGEPSTVTQDVAVEQITHTITPSTHRMTLGLGQANIKTQFILDTSTLDTVSIGLG